MEWTGSVVGWYGLLAPEIMEVLEASPSKPSVSSVVLMMISRYFNNITTCNLKKKSLSFLLTHDASCGSRSTLCSMWGWKWMEKANQTVRFSQPPDGQTAAAEGARHEAGENPLEVRLNVRQPCPVSGWLITQRLSKLSGVITLLGGSLVQTPLHPQTVPASSAALGKNTERFAAAAVRISAHCGPEGPRESRAERYCEVPNSLYAAPSQSTLTLLAVDAGRACLRPSEDCTFLCGLHDRICARETILQQPGTRIQSEPQWQNSVPL